MAKMQVEFCVFLAFLMTSYVQVKCDKHIADCPKDAEPVSCFTSPCAAESCPRFPNAMCVDDYCGKCSAVFHTRRGRQVIPKFACSRKSRWPACLKSIDCVQPPYRCLVGCLGFPDAVCLQDCDCGIVFLNPRTGKTLNDEECEFKCLNGKEVAPCDSRPCGSETCPRFPNALCANDYCGGCNAVFTNPVSGDIIPKFACSSQSNWPTCLETIDCVQPPYRCLVGCLGVPDAICLQNCDCGIVFVDPTTGRTLTDEDCAFTCLNGKKVAPCDSRPCGSETCPRFPNALCANDYCGGCNAVFTDPVSGDIIPKFACSSQSNWPTCLETIDCVQPPYRCLVGCLGVPDAICLQNCDCGILFVDPTTGQTLSDEECAFTCSDGKEVAPCGSRPCGSETCPRFPNALCANDYCGGCNAVFTNPVSGNIIPKFACSDNSDWPACLNTANCEDSSLKCQSACPNFPNAVCSQDCDCSLMFTDPFTGRILDSDECSGVGLSEFEDA